MKNIIKLFCIPVLVMAFVGCKKEETKIFIEKSTPPVFTHTDGEATLVLTKATEKAFAARFDWTNPNFEFTTGVSSQSVTYTVQADTSGKHFEKGSIDLTAIDNNLNVTVTQGDLNKWLLPVHLVVDVPHNIEFRIKAAVKGSASAVYSNIIPLTITPYLDVIVPLPKEGTLWALGSAFASSWDNPLKAPYDVDQKFTKVSETVYELTVNFIGGGNFKFIQKQGEWNTQYRPKYASGVPFATGDFEQKDADPGWDGPAAAGLYKITLDFVTGKYKIEKV
ncbi:MAG: SusE domain-containing protein [Ferruginibacter sp.]